jgi:subtilisin-like proprotein convertase family protein
MRIPKVLAPWSSLGLLVSLSACGGGAGIGGGGPGGGGPGTQSFSNSTVVTLPDSGHAAVYPSTITVGGMVGTISNVTVQLIGVTHGFPDDIDVALVSPEGTQILLLSDCGGTNDLFGVTLTFDDSGILAPDSGALAATTYLPTNNGPFGDDPFAGPPGAPTGSFGLLLSLLNGESPNGTWRLYALDDDADDGGSIQGWQLVITTQ